jgi:hypothetical protein
MGRAPALIVALIGACSSRSGTHAPDAAIADSTADAASGSDADLVDYPFTGAFLDWDSTTAAPCPIVGATWAAHYDASRTTTTDASGTFTLTLASWLNILDVTPPAGASACASPSASYTIPGIAIPTPAVIHAGGAFEARSLTTARVATFYASFGATFDASRGQLFVHVDGAPRAVSISYPSGPAQAFDGNAWGTGATGVDVFFPNIDLSGGMMPAVTVDGGATGTGGVPLAAGSITYMTVITN